MRVLVRMDKAWRLGFARGARAGAAGPNGPLDLSPPGQRPGASARSTMPSYTTEEVILQRGLEQVANELDLTWIIVSTVLVFFMQAGFAFLEIGFSRGKNVGMGIAKILGNFSIATIAWWGMGFAIAFGGSGWLAGDTGFFLTVGNSVGGTAADFGSSVTGGTLAFFAFQFMFCAVSLAIVWGSTLERIKFVAYIPFAVVFAAVIYPLIAHWGFGGGLFGEIGQGVQDFAGSSVVHLTGATAAFAALLLAVDDGLARLHPDGNTDIDQAVRTAIDGLRDTDARLRHIVLFTDGFTETGSLVDVAGEALDAGITLSVVATGEGPPETGEQLRRMAEAGGGRFYPGRDLSSIPNILALEVRMAVRPVVNEGSFLPLVTGTAPATEDLTESPPLLGYLATTSKPTTRTLLRIGEERDPLLATWQAGLGTATAWTSDVAPRWSAQWVTWDRFAGFWSAVVKDTFPAEEDLRGTLSATATGEGVRVRLDAAGTVPADAAATVSVTGPDGERVEAPLDRVELGAFEAVVGSGRAALDDEGVYAVSARLARGEEELYRGTVTAIRSYPAEYAASDGDPTLLQGAVAAVGGRLDPAAASVFDPAGLAPGAGTRPLWPWLAVLALVLAGSPAPGRPRHGARRRLPRRAVRRDAHVGDRRRLPHHPGRGGRRGPRRRVRPRPLPRPPRHGPRPPEGPRRSGVKKPVPELTESLHG